ncbi:XRE family transcriptional regulator [Geothermobacter ehrlichii]|uniref:XRE family transcriptional regulator n=1 Tax=Geothermobacter ehrlichii TaxID=213224 RepID=A0A5D3WET0_9BACT|nr:XRE family transcriptional regulator [Geothermobacter ehrlichii]TYO95782.1 XRE family transcriptional regulator [Geothermobacter ehrlichii]
MSADSKLAGRVRQLREERQLTIEQLAEQSRCHVDVLTRIEAGELVPSLTPLMSIARALGVRLGTLLDDEPHDGPAVVKKGQSPAVIRFSGKDPEARRSNLDFYALGVGKKDRHMEPFVIDVQPREGDEPPLSSHEGEEFLYVLEGCIEVRLGKTGYRLEAGESIYYDSIVPHDVHAVGGPARILAVVYAPF